MNENLVFSKTSKSKFYLYGKYVNIRNSDHSSETKFYGYCPKCKSFHEFYATFAWDFNIYTETKDLVEVTTEMPQKKICRRHDNDFYLLNADLCEAINYSPSIPDSIVKENGENTLITRKYSYKIVRYYCPKCLYSVSKDDVMTYNKKNLYSTENIELVWTGIFKRDNKLTIRSIFKYAGVYQSRLVIEKYNVSLVFNVTTGQTYMLSPQYMSGKPAPKKVRNMFCSKIRNMTFGNIIYPMDNLIHDETLLKAMEVLHEMKKEELGYNLKSILEYDDKDFNKKYYDNTSRNIRVLMFYNRYPNLNPYEYSTILSLRYLRKERSKLSKLKPNESNQIGMLMDICNVKNSKQYRKLVLEDYDNLRAIKVLNNVFCQDNIIKILKHKLITDVRSISNYNAETMKSFIYKLGERTVKNNILANDTKSISTLELEETKQLIYKAGENNFIKKIESKPVSIYTIQDTYNMMERIEKELGRTFRYKGDLQTIHDKLSKIINSLRSKNTILTYPEEQLEKQCVINGYKFEFAKETNDLKRIGQAMHICVGSYDNSARDGECNIVYVLKDEKYAACIELDETFESVCQAKSYCNKYPVGELKETILLWMSKFKLKNKTGDLSNEEEGYGCEINPDAAYNQLVEAPENIELLIANL